MCSQCSECMVTCHYIPCNLRHEYITSTVVEGDKDRLVDVWLEILEKFRVPIIWYTEFLISSDFNADYSLTFSLVVQSVFLDLLYCETGELIM